MPVNGVKEQPALAACRRLVQSLHYLPADEVLALALDCPADQVRQARYKLEGEGFKFSPDTDGGWLVTTLPFDRSRVKAAIIGRLDRMSDAEMKEFVQFMEDMVLI